MIHYWPAVRRLLQDCMSPIQQRLSIRDHCSAIEVYQYIKNAQLRTAEDATAFEKAEHNYNKKSITEKYQAL